MELEGQKEWSKLILESCQMTPIEDSSLGINRHWILQTAKSTNSRPLLILAAEPASIIKDGYQVYWYG